MSNTLPFSSEWEVATLILTLTLTLTLTLLRVKPPPKPPRIRFGSVRLGSTMPWHG